MMTKSTRKRSLSLGSLCRRAGGFAVVLPVLWSGIAAPWVHAQTPPWDEGGSGGVQVSLTQLTSAPALPTTATTLDIRVGESETYYLRLTDNPPIPANDPWWVMVHVDGQTRIDNHDEHYKGLSWTPSLGREFKNNNWGNWVGIRITAHETDDEYGAKAGTSVLFKHEVWDHDAECPVHTKKEHKLRSGWVRVNIIAKAGTTDNNNSDNNNPDNNNPDNTNPDNTNPDNTNPDNTNPDNTNPDNTNPENTNPDKQ